MRLDIKRLLDQPYQAGEYKRMKEECGLPHYVDAWFEGCIKSLFYKPNTTALVLVGPQMIGKTQFIRRLFPDQKFISEGRGDIYNHFIIERELQGISIPIVKRHNFYCKDIGDGTAEVDKRLASYCCTTNTWPFERRKSFIVVNSTQKLRNINSIDVLSMWKELFATYRLRAGIS